MKIVIKDLFLKQMLNIQKMFLIFMVNFHFQLTEKKSKNAKSLFFTCMIKKLCCTDKNLKENIKSWISTLKSTQSNPV